MGRKEAPLAPNVIVGSSMSGEIRTKLGLRKLRRVSQGRSKQVEVWDAPKDVHTAGHFDDPSDCFRSTGYSEKLYATLQYFELAPR